MLSLAVGLRSNFSSVCRTWCGDKLAKAATANGRSLNSEIIHRLTQSLERDEMNKLSNHLKAHGDRLAKVEEEIAALVEQLRFPQMP